MNEQIQRLTEHPENIFDEWKLALGFFAMAGQSGRSDRIADGKWIGCITMIKDNPELYQAQTPELTAAILADDRIPRNGGEITVDDLLVFLEWKNRIDQELGR